MTFCINITNSTHLKASKKNTINMYRSIYQVFINKKIKSLLKRYIFYYSIIIVTGLLIVDNPHIGKFILFVFYPSPG